MSQWNRLEVDAERQAIALELSQLPDSEPAIQVGHLLNRMNRIPVENDSPARLVTILETLRLHARFGVLSKTDCHRFNEMARLILTDRKLFARSSRLSFLAAELTQIESELACADGRLLEACWLAEAGAALAEDEPTVQLARARSLARSGQVLAAVSIYQKMIASSERCSTEVTWGLIRCLRAAGQVDAALELYLEHECNLPQNQWFPLSCALQKNLDFDHFAFLLRTSDSATPLDLIYGKAWLYAGGKRSLYHQLPSVESLLRKLTRAEKLTYGPFVRALQHLEKAYQDGQPLIVKMTYPLSALKMLNQMPTCEEEVLVLAGILRFLLKFHQYSHARFVLNEYCALSLKLTGASSKDCLGVIGEVNFDKIHGKAGVSRSIALTALRTLAKGAAVVTTSRLRALANLSAPADQLKEKELERLSEILAEGLGALRGGMMKVGQILSLIADLSPTFKNPLRRMQFGAEPSPLSDAVETFTAEFGNRPLEVFQHWESQPIAIGSIGQVYYAQTQDNREVAIKIRHKDIEGSLRQDLRLLALIKPIIQRMIPAGNITAILNEIRTQLLMEVDYIREANYQNQFRRHFADDPDIIIPELIPEYCNKKVISSEYIQAIPFETFCQTASQAARNRAGCTIARMFYESLFDMHLFNCDPHPNNYLFLEDGRTVFLDFGCVKQFDQDFVSALRQFTLSALAGDAEAHFDCYLKLGYFQQNDPVDPAACLRMGQIMAEPLMKDREFTINKEYVRRTAEGFYTNNANLRRYLVPPVDSVMLVRFTFGLLAVLADLEPTANWHRLFMERQPQPSHLIS